MAIDARQIPPEVVEAARSAWDELDLKGASGDEMFRAAIAAGLAAWPGADRSEVEPADGGEWLESLILPLPQEASDGE